MTRRERWLWCGLVPLCVAVPALLWWQFTRHATAQHAVQQFIALQGQSTPKDEGQAALLQQTRLSVSSLLQAGDFDGALESLAQFAAYRPPSHKPSASSARKPTTEIKGSELWPPGSQARARARQILLLVMEKRNQGYRIAMVQEALLEVAQHARDGNKKLALATFDRVEELLKASTERTGTPQAASQLITSQTPGVPGRPMPPGVPMPPRLGTPPPANMGQPPGVPPPGQTADPRIEGMLQFFQKYLPQALAQAPPQQRPFMLRLQNFGNEFVTAYGQGKDLRGVAAMVMAIMEKAGPPGSGQNTKVAMQQLDQAQVALRHAPRLSNPHMAPMPVPAGVPRPGLAPPSGPTAKASPGKGLPTGGDERLLQMLDAVRSMPEPVYRQQRGSLAAAIGHLAGSSPPLPPAKAPPVVAEPTRSPVIRPRPTPGVTPRATPGAAKPAQPSATPSVRPTSPAARAVPGTPAPPVVTAGVRLDIDSSTVIRGLHAFGKDLSAGLTSGGFSLLLPDRHEVILRGFLRPAGSASSAELDAAHGLSVTSRGEDHGIALEAFFDGRQQPAGTALLIKLPLRAQGWNWRAGEQVAKIGSRGVYISSVNAAGDGMKMVSLIGPGIHLTVSAPRAASIAYDASANALLVRFPIDVVKAKTSYALHLVADR